MNTKENKKSEVFAHIMDLFGITDLQYVISGSKHDIMVCNVTFMDYRDVECSLYGQADIIDGDEVAAKVAAQKNAIAAIFRSQLNLIDTEMRHLCEVRKAITVQLFDYLKSEFDFGLESQKSIYD